MTATTVGGVVYLFATYQDLTLEPGVMRLNSGGLTYCIDEVEHLAELDHNPIHKYQRDGLWVGNDPEYEWARDTQYVISNRLTEVGITWDWFRPYHSFGNGVTCSKSWAGMEEKLVIHGTNLSEREYIKLHGAAAMKDLMKELKQQRTESWEKYQNRWALDANGMTTCPQENHWVSITSVVTTHPVPQFAYDRIRCLVEENVDPLYRNTHYSLEPNGNHFSDFVPYHGESPYHHVVGRNEG